MRKAFAKAMVEVSSDPNLFFFTVDVGFMALEEVRDAFGDRFVNAGVAEQNLIGVSAGMAKEGYKVFSYSIAPFLYARPFEQIRNDICFSKLPVCLVGNGGGYAYGHMGPTHHALEDCAAMSALGVRVLVPAFDEDLSEIIKDIAGPTYLRLGYDARPAGSPVTSYSPWRKVLDGQNGLLVALGPLAGVAMAALADFEFEKRPAVWAVCELGEGVVPLEFLEKVRGANLYLFEEHMAEGGLGMQLAYSFLKKGILPARFLHRHALGYPSGTYGSQEFHRKQCGLDRESIRNLFLNTP
jgi:transketolase